MSKHLGDFETSTVVYGKFTTYRPSTGAPFTLAGTPALSVYKDNSTTQSTTGVTLTVDFDSVTGLSHYAVDTSADGTFYAAGSFFDVVITTGTVDSISAVGTVVGSFTIRKNSSIKSVRSGTAQAGAATTITLDASASGTNNLYVGLVIVLTGGTGAGQARTITGYNQGTKIATVDRNWTTNPSNTSTFAILAADNPALNNTLQVGNGANTIVIRTGTAQTGSTANTIKLDSGASATNNLYSGALVQITSGTGLGQVRTIVSYVGSTKIATVDRNWVTTPDNTSAFSIVSSSTPSTFSDQGVAQAATSSTITLASTASATSSIYNGSIVTILSGTDAGDTAEITAYNGTTKVATITPNWAVTPDTTSAYAVIPVVASSGVVTGTDPLSSAVPGTYAAGTAGYVLGTNLDALVSSRLAPTVAARTLDVSATGEAGIDWANVGSPTTTLNLTGTTISSSQVVASVAGAVGSVTGSVGSISGVSFPTDFSSLAITAAGGVTMGDGVAHGGTPGSSTATLAMQQVAVTNPSGNAIAIAATGGHGIDVESTGGIGLYLYGDSAGMKLDGDISLFLSGADGAGQPGACIYMSMHADGDMVQADNSARVGHVINLRAGGTGKHGVISTGGTDGDGFHGVGAGTGVGFRSVADAVGFGAGGSGLDAEGVRDAIGLATANLDTQLSTLSTYGGGDTSGTTTLLARLTGTRASNLDNLDAAVSTRLATSGYTAPPSAASIATAVLTTAMTESYNADGAAPTPAQALYVIMQRLTEFSISATTITVNKLDGETPAYTLTMDAAASTATSSTRAT